MGNRGGGLIVAFIAITAFSVAVTYVLSVALGHVKPFIPHLSYLGDRPVESTIFTQCFVVDAAALAFVVQVRFVQAFRKLEAKKSGDEAHAVNLAGAWMGHASAVGLFVLACFQESNAFYVHHLAGVLLFYSASVSYFAIQSVVSLRIASADRSGFHLLKVRAVLNGLMIVSLAVFQVGHLVALRLFDRPWEERALWTCADGGWRFHVASAFSEWTLLFLFQLYFLTFYFEFQRVVLTKTRILVILNEERTSS